MNTNGYIGIDFGTNNSHFACALLNDGTPRADSIVLNNRPSNATCVLWKKPGMTEEDILHYGDLAVEEWLLCEPDQRSTYRFSACFKPDLVGLERARLDAWAFLRKAVLEMRQQRTPGNIGASEGMPVVVGVPAEISEQHKEITRQVASEAGLGDVECVAEPLGALAFHLSNGQIRDEEAQEGVIVIDFGGGTLDVALVDKDGIREPWGNPILGGRLFDDLFYQWLIEKNPKIDLHGFSEDDLMATWCCGCKKLKEDFSRHWKRRGVEADFTDFRGGVCLQTTNQFVGRLQNVSSSEFRERASAYRPTEIARRYFNEVGGNLASIGTDGPVDLLEMIYDALSNSGRVDRKSRDYSLVILTGGSSSWPFMSQLAAEVFGVGPDQIIASASPEVTIGQGLAIYNVIRDGHRAARKRIESERAQGRQALIKEVDKKLANFSKEIAKVVSTRLMTQIRPIYLAWYREGGKLIEVEEKAAKLCHDFAPERLVEERLGQLKQEITHLTIAFVADWLKGHGIKTNLERVALVLSSNSSAKSSNKLEISGAIEDGVAGTFTTMLAGVVAIVGGMLAGGGGFALIMGGPVGWLIGACITFAAVVGCRGQIKEGVRTFAFQGVSLSVLHSVIKENALNEKLDEAEATLSASLSEKIGKDVEANKKDLILYLDQSIELVIRRFSALEQISPLH